MLAGTVPGKRVAFPWCDWRISQPISEEDRGSGRSPEVFKVLCPVSVAGRPGRCRPEVASRPGPGRRGPLAGRLDAVATRLDEACAARGADHLRTATNGGSPIDLGKRRSPGQ
ncbi:hypothetical protein GCM10027614_43870 [Micromonospora vulcania]